MPFIPSKFDHGAASQNAGTCRLILLNLSSDIDFLRLFKMDGLASLDPLLFCRSATNDHLLVGSHLSSKSIR